MKIDLYRLTQCVVNEVEDFRRMVRGFADSYLEMLSFRDMCMLRVDFMRENAMSFPLYALHPDFWLWVIPGNVYVDDEEKAHEIILDEFDKALQTMFNTSLEYELDHSDDGRADILMFPDGDERNYNVGIEAVSLNRNEVTVAYRGRDVWRIGEVPDVYDLWRELDGKIEEPPKENVPF